MKIPKPHNIRRAELGYCAYCIHKISSQVFIACPRCVGWFWTDKDEERYLKDGKNDKNYFLKKKSRLELTKL
jgi:hypothetical protein